jgi:uncharacterized protein YdhG (YjbR/CyaY superfamily)
VARRKLELEQKEGKDMQSTARDVSEYLEEIPLERRAALTRLRQLCLDVLDGHQEIMRYGMACYQRPDATEPDIAFASQKRHIALYVLKKLVLDANRALLTTASIGKGCVRYSRPQKIDFEVVKKVLLETKASTDPIC